MLFHPAILRLQSTIREYRALLLVLVLTLLLVQPTLGRAENSAPYSGTVTLETGKPFNAYVKSFRKAIKANGFNVVGVACAKCAIKSRFNEKVAGNRVFMFFRPDYARRMLQASIAAGIEAPLRAYVTETPDGTAKLTYRLPSHVFGAYDVTALTKMGEELDDRVAKLVEDAANGA